jgi:hypothetical protein
MPDEDAVSGWAGTTGQEKDATTLKLLGMTSV